MLFRCWVGPLQPHDVVDVDPGAAELRHLGTPVRNFSRTNVCCVCVRQDLDEDGLLLGVRMGGDFLHGVVVGETALDGEDFLGLGAVIFGGAVMTIQVQIAETEQFGVDGKPGKTFVSS